MALFSPWGNQQFFDDNGNPATGWKIYAYAAGSNTPLATFTTSAGDVAQSQPIILNSLGFPTNGQIFLTSGLAYKLVLTNASDVVKKTADDITGVTSAAAVSQWGASGLTPTYVSATSFTLSGDQTSAFHVGRRLQSTTTAGTIYSTITATAYTTLTTVTVSNDSGVLDSGLAAVNYALLTSTNNSIPGVVASATQAQTHTAFTTAGTATAYTLTPSPALAALAAGQRFRVKFNAANGAAPTLAVSGLAATALKVYDSTGAKIAPPAGTLALNMLSDVEYDGTDWVVLDRVNLAASGANSDITSLSAITSINGGPIGGSRNRLINGNFGINQRGYVSGDATTAGQYTLDRWKVTGTGGITFSTTNNVTTVTIPSGQTLQQVIEGVNLQSGTHVLSWSGTAQGRIDGGAYGASGAVTATAVGGTNMTVEFNTGTVSLAQLEEGSLASRFEQRLIGVELALCQRYYQVTPVPLTIQTSTASTNNDLLRVPFRETMRTAPTVSAIGGSGTLTFVSGASGVNSVLYRFDVSGAGVGGVSGTMTASAEL